MVEIADRELVERFSDTRLQQLILGIATELKGKKLIEHDELMEAILRQLAVSEPAFSNDGYYDEFLEACADFD